jgi:hypothetical protein
MSGDDIDDPSAYSGMTDAQKAALQFWIAAMFRPAKTVDRDNSSYALKHHLEESGFYVPNGKFKGAMLAAGYKPVKWAEKNWSFRCRSVRKSDRPCFKPAYDIAHMSEADRMDRSGWLQKQVARHSTALDRS